MAWGRDLWGRVVPAVFLVSLMLLAACAPQQDDGEEEDMEDPPLSTEGSDDGY